MSRQVKSESLVSAIKTPLRVLEQHEQKKVSGAGPHGGWARPEEASAPLPKAPAGMAGFGPHGGW